jgi:1,2-phenylacetyl-CoA epoxidase PaaB subunit
MAKRTTYRYAVTYEYPTDASDTLRGVEVSSLFATAGRRALEAARAAFPRKQPSSVVLLLEPQD